MDNTAKILSFQDYKNNATNEKLNTIGSENELSTQELLLKMMCQIEDLKKQVEENNKSKVKKERKRIEHNGEMIVKKEYSKISLTEEQIEIIEKTFREYIKKEDAYMKSRYKLYMYFVIQLNCALRISDILSLRFYNLIDKMDLNNGEIKFREEIGLGCENGILEKKTRNSRNNCVNRHITINNNMKRIISLYLNNFKDTKLDEFLFTNQSTNSNNDSKAISKQSIDYSLKIFAKRSNLDIILNSHNLRRTWSRNYYIQQGATHEALVELQMMLGHTTIAMTEKYLGLSKDKIADGYLNNNVGMKSDVENEIGNLNH